ncbi:MAG TPA: family 78 glycoside hydrolase catalytic domain [Verrucomicrobiae bacterium]|nr:family 78 glycoside hydrolase catalytic domain [Verrucomicrobiae bacterium]
MNQPDIRGPIRISRLRCEYLQNPLGIDEIQPRLSWILQSDRRGAKQTAWQIRVASSSKLLASNRADLWDSGRIEGDQSTHIAYAGSPLSSRMECHWHVTIWDEQGQAITSAPALWTMGLLNPNDWQARWISHDPEIIRRDADALESTPTQPGTCPLLRKHFEVAGIIQRATLYVSARGIVDLQLNGHRVTEDRFIPEWTDYNKRLHYRAFDVTPLLRRGENALGAFLGDGWWSGFVGWQEVRGQYGTLQNSLLVQLEIEAQTSRVEFPEPTGPLLSRPSATLSSIPNGEEGRGEEVLNRPAKKIIITSDRSWRCETGPILSADFMMGETYDAQRDRAGWDRPGFDDSAWLHAIEVPPARVHIPKFGFSNNKSRDTDRELPLVAQRSEPVRVVETLRPVSVTEIKPGVFIYDLGQNIAGWMRIAVQGAAGTRVQLRHAERLNPDGTLYTDNLRRARATDIYILKGDGEETWEPRFTFHGFQYVELSGLENALPLEKISGCVVMSATPAAGHFECSHPLVSRLWQNALWGQKGNFLSVPTDCPQRDERLGWMGDAQVFLRTATYNMDVAAFFTKWMIDVTDSQDVDGIFPDVAPRLREGEGFAGLDGLGGAAGWADAGIIVPWTLWRVYGDRRIIERHWDSMVRWLDWLEKSNPNGIRANALNNNYGDWLCIPSDREFRTQSPMKTLLATAYWADDAAKMARMARELGRDSDAERFDRMFESVRNAFQKEWLRNDGRLEVETQTAYLLALAFNLLPQEVRSRAADHLVENIRNLNWHLSTGFIGISHLNPILTLSGHADVAYRLLLNQDYPSWLYPVIHGATTIWERWNGWTEKDGFFNPAMNSFNHYSLGSVGEWLYRHVAGIELDSEIPGFKRFVIRPWLGLGISSADARYDSIHGRIESRWTLEGNAFELHLTIPANTSAIVTLPHGTCEILEGGIPAEKSAGIRLLNPHEPGTFEVQSGRYAFTARIRSQ